MGSRKRKSRIWWRNGRAWGDFRDYADVGGKREPLRFAGERVSTEDADVAEMLAQRRLADLRALRARRRNSGRVLAPCLEDFARLHLIEKRRSGKVTDHWLAALEGFLRRAVAHFGASRPLDEIRPSDVR